MLVLPACDAGGGSSGGDTKGPFVLDNGEKGLKWTKDGDPGDGAVSLDGTNKNGGANGIKFAYKSNMGFYSFILNVDTSGCKSGDALSFWMKGVGAGEMFLSIYDTSGNEYKIVWGATASEAQTYVKKFSEFNPEGGHSGTLSYNNIDKIKFGFQDWVDTSYSMKSVYVDDISILVAE